MNSGQKLRNGTITRALHCLATQLRRRCVVVLSVVFQALCIAGYIVLYKLVIFIVPSSYSQTILENSVSAQMKNKIFDQEIREFFH